ncbi:hypothetical protein EJ05DRAFT_503361 [Pseudovirgaria hyperparasitica]|uniref:S-adenosyl-L-methionine-dependent methyltransferase n=1 Tax=Pseudovirgaria hyperparasitica TaxID=470096 RepID=A0A6A6VYV0_9PEZI|nr:uncharacterized protein EJ05DRAFT_503361 [Pseudovirgaria hyperparasitica]KAF2755049.1 hypothetical protein EJ05DRAFT_503361 [Pseudovirgaria hyperparasitica]
MSTPETEAASYMMGYSSPEAERLDSQHILMRHMNANRLLSPQLHSAVRAGKIKKILDIGTGTGIWPYDTTSEMKTLGASGPLRFVGTDVAQSVHWVRHQIFDSNIYATITFDIIDLNDEDSMMGLRDKYGPFDLVHSRLLFSSIKDGKWPAYLARIFRLLRPGGYVQLVENDIVNAAACMNNQIAAESLVIAYGIYRGLGLQVDIAAHLAKLQLHAGFVDISDELRLVTTCHRKSDGNIVVDNVAHEWIVSAFQTLKPLFRKFRTAPNYAELISNMPPQVYDNAPESRPELLLADEDAYSDFQERHEEISRTDPLYQLSFRIVVGKKPE